MLKCCIGYNYTNIHHIEREVIYYHKILIFSTFLKELNFCTMADVIFFINEN